MRFATIIKLVLLCVACAGLINITLLLAQYPLTDIDKQLVTSLFKQDPTYFYYALSSIAIMLALLIWQTSSRRPTKIYNRFHEIDSNTLDTNSQLALEFYRAVLFYRIRYGHRRYQRHIVKHFDFFYDYHNYALTWIDEIIGRINARVIPEHFILSSIAAGHIGRVYHHAQYATGLPASNLKKNAPLIFHDCAENIEIWSYYSRNPLCSLKKNTIKLHTTHRHPDYISAILTGINPGERDKVMVELRFLTQSATRQQRSEAVAKHNLHEFQKWLKQTSKTSSRFLADNGIEVTELGGDDPVFTTPLIRHLEQLVYRKIDAFYPRSRLPLADTRIALDALVLCNGIGLIAISEKHEKGELTYNGDSTWYQNVGNTTIELQNPCIQAKLARSSIANLLTGHNLTRWPVISLVVYSKDDINLNMTMGTKRLQCPVLKLTELEKWINKYRIRHPEVVFTQNDITLFNSVLGQKQPLSGVV